MNQPSQPLQQPMPGEFSGYLKENLNPAETYAEQSSSDEAAILKQEREGARAAALAAIHGGSLEQTTQLHAHAPEARQSSPGEVAKLMTDIADRLEQLRAREGGEDLRRIQSGDYDYAA